MSTNNDKEKSSAKTHPPARSKNAESEATVVRLDRVRDRLEIKRLDAHTDALAARFHTAMGWQGKPKKPNAGKGKRKKKP